MSPVSRGGMNLGYVRTRVFHDNIREDYKGMCSERTKSCIRTTMSGVGGIQKWSHQVYYMLICKHKGRIGFSRFVILRVYLRCFLSPFLTTALEYYRDDV